MSHTMKYENEEDVDADTLLVLLMLLHYYRCNRVIFAFISCCYIAQNLVTVYVLLGGLQTPECRLSRSSEPLLHFFFCGPTTINPLCPFPSPLLYISRMGEKLEWPVVTDKKVLFFAFVYQNKQIN